MRNQDNKKTLPKVQVIMSTYNGEKYIKEQIMSIFAQEGCRVTLLIRDDGSSDDTANIINEFAKIYPIKIFVGKNLGPAKSFLEAMAITDEVDYYAFSDQDDVWKKDKLFRAIQKINENYYEGPILYCGNLCTVDENLNFISMKALPDFFSLDYEDLLIHSSNIFGCTMVFNNELRKIVISQSPENPIMHDLWIGLLAVLSGILIYDAEPYILYRQHNNNQVGAQESLVKKWENRVGYFKGNYKGAISKQSKDILAFMRSCDYYGEKKRIEYTKIVALYDESLWNKLLYLFKVSRKGMSRKQWIFHVILVLKGCV